MQRKKEKLLLQLFHLDLQWKFKQHILNSYVNYVIELQTPKIYENRRFLQLLGYNCNKFTFLFIFRCLLLAFGSTDSDEIFSMYITDIDSSNFSKRVV